MRVSQIPYPISSFFIAEFLCFSQSITLNHSLKHKIANYRHFYNTQLSLLLLLFFLCTFSPSRPHQSHPNKSTPPIFYKPIRSDPCRT